MQDKTFTDFEWIAIDNALEALLTELEETADPEFSVALENVVFAYDLDEEMEKEVVDQYEQSQYPQYPHFV